MPRCITWLGGAKTVLYGYDTAGNLELKDDHATLYEYSDPRPNAVSQITNLDASTVSFDYDANGNLLSGDGKSLTYTPFNNLEKKH